MSSRMASRRGGGLQSPLPPSPGLGGEAVPSHRPISLVGLAALVCLAGGAAGKERTERFDKDPGWEGVNNRADSPAKRAIVQDFGYSGRTANAGGKAGEVGGLVTP